GYPSMTKAFTISGPPGSLINDLTFSAAGNLYVTSLDYTVLVFSPPFSGASTPVATPPTSNVWGVAVGP
ncbi:MAG: hypothetical protein M3Z41_06300, partial [Candidatus Eremiobacteraeota bacterium]|nr:hypothetical protein [Candidatus Eremiobacteraeota bacterium]